MIASPGNRASEVAGMEQSCDHVARLIAAVLRLCEVERRASDAGNLYTLAYSRNKKEDICLVLLVCQIEKKIPMIKLLENSVHLISAKDYL